jgi:cytochrome b561
MKLKSSSAEYGTVAIAIHWLSAALIIAMFVLGIVASETTDPLQKSSILRIHAPVGLFVLALTILRITWWLVADKKPAAVAGQSPWQKSVSTWVHRILYFCILGMAGSGIWLLRSSGAGEIIFDGANKPMPDLETFFAYSAHSTIALVFEALIVLHVLAALYHQFVLRDRLLARMGIGRRNES